jgi:carbonic anhydrase
MRLSFLVSLSFALCAASIPAQSPNWTYEGKTGPLVWGKLDSAYQACGKGHEQSPIDIRGAHLDKSLQPIEFHYVAGPVTLENNGRGVVAHVDSGSTIVAGGVRYHLVDIDFHHPAEHPIKGKLSDMEVDLIHRSDDGKMAIIAVLLNSDREFPNATLSTLWTHLPVRSGANERVTDMVSAGGFLPSDRGYWTYTGSELTPPCAEGVRWFIFEQDLSMSRGQLQAFTRLFTRPNTRPVQDPHGRHIAADE